MSGERRTVIFYGNCQMRALGVDFANVLERAGYAIRYLLTYDGATVESWPSAADVADCAVLFEQIDAFPFPLSEDLPAECPIVRFPALDTNVLWPFEAINPYDRPRAEGEAPARGRYPYGNRVILRCIEREWSAERTIDYYLNNYEDYRLELGRIVEIDRARLAARDAKSDVKMYDAVHDVVSAPLFWSHNHPRVSLLAILARRLAAAAATHLPVLAGYEPPENAFAKYVKSVAWTAVPIHPGVAADLGFDWYDPDERYPQADGSHLTHVEFVRSFVEATVRNRRLLLDGGTAEAWHAPQWDLPIEGPVRLAGPALGIFPDAFAAPHLRFELEATAPIERLTLEAYYPPQHVRRGTVTCEVGAQRAQATPDPGTAFELVLPLVLEAGHRARVVLACSESINMFERGEGEDTRDLGVLILKVCAA